MLRLALIARLEETAASSPRAGCASRLGLTWRSAGCPAAQPFGTPRVSSEFTRFVILLIVVEGTSTTAQQYVPMAHFSELSKPVAIW